MTFVAIHHNLPPTNGAHHRKRPAAPKSPVHVARQKWSPPESTPTPFPTLQCRPGYSSRPPPSTPCPPTASPPPWCSTPGHRPGGPDDDAPLSEVCCRAARRNAPCYRTKSWRACRCCWRTTWRPWYWSRPPGVDPIGRVHWCVARRFPDWCRTTVGTPNDWRRWSPLADHSWVAVGRWLRPPWRSGCCGIRKTKRWKMFEVRQVKYWLTEKIYYV